MTRKLIPSFVTIAVAVVIVVCNFIPSIKFPVPFVSEAQTQCDPQKTSILTCGGCTEKGVFAKGFPFRTNLYDYCKQDDTQIQWIQGLNVAVSAFILAGVYFLLRNKFQ